MIAGIYLAVALVTFGLAGWQLHLNVEDHRPTAAWSPDLATVAIVAGFCGLFWFIGLPWALLAWAGRWAAGRRLSAPVRRSAARLRRAPRR